VRTLPECTTIPGLCKKRSALGETGEVVAIIARLLREPAATSARAWTMEGARLAWLLNWAEANFA